MEGQTGSEIVHAHLLVSGRVQGVAFRAYTQAQARQLGVAGWVRNVADGRVEIHVSGPRERVEELIRWCSRGSPSARVRDVNVRWVDVPGEPSSEGGFSIRY